MAEGAHKVTQIFEERLSDYTGAPYVAAIDNLSNALFLALVRDNAKGKIVSIPSHTYPSVPCEIIHAGAKVNFIKSDKFLSGAYQLKGTKVWDSALRFTCDMYIPNSFMCVSFTGPYKHLKLGKGGAILTDDEESYMWFKRARFSGRRECSYANDNFDMLGWNFYMLPEIACKGVHLMDQFYDRQGNRIPNEDICLPYPDLSKYDIYKESQ